MKKRGFEKVSKYIDVDFNLPKRSTKTSAGYDFESPVDIDIAPGETAFVPTGVKAYMQDDEVLHLYNRSSNGVKGLILINSVGIIDSDYYNNLDNEGEMAFVFKNTSDKTFSIKQGDRIGQGVFQKFLTIDNEEEIVSERKGGFGSTNKKGITLIALGITMIVLIIILSITVSLTVYNIDQSRKNTFLSEVQIVQNAALEIINTSKIDGMDVPDKYKTLPLTSAEITEYSEYLTSSTNDYYFLTYNQLKVMGITNMKEEQQFIVNWSTGEVLNLNVSKYKGTIIKANPVI